MIFVKLIVFFFVFCKSSEEPYKKTLTDGKATTFWEDRGDLNLGDTSTEISLNVTELLEPSSTESPHPECGGEITLTDQENSTTISSPVSGGAYPLKVECIWVIRRPPEKLIDLDVESATSLYEVTERDDYVNQTIRCAIKFLEVRDGDSESSPLISSYNPCTEYPAVVVVSSDNVIFVKYLLYFDRIRPAFRARLSLTICGGTIRSTQGKIWKPSPPNIRGDIWCIWRLIGPVGQRFTIQLTEVIPETRFYPYTVTISERDTVSNNVTILASYYGAYVPPPLVTSSNKATIVFDGAVGDPTFFLIFNANELDCGGIYQDAERSIQTPNYGADYPNNTECAWEIRPKPGYYIGLRFIEDFHIEESDNCENDYLEVWDWRDSNWTSIARICGKNHRITYDPQKVKWDFLCGGTFEVLRGTPRSIISPGYPDGYESNLKCVYNITATSGSVNIFFDNINIHHQGDSVNIRSSHRFVRGMNEYFFGGYQRHYKVMEGYILVIFHTNDVYNSRGFKFTYFGDRKPCGGNITEDTILEVESLHSSYHLFYDDPMIRCVWRAITPLKQVPVLRLVNFSITDDISNEYLQIFNGLSDKLENRLITLGGHIKEDLAIHANSGGMLIKLSTTPVSFTFKTQLYFSPGPTEGSGGHMVINLKETKHIAAPDLDNLDCVWTIEVDINHQVNIRITELNLPDECTENSTSCSFVEIRDGGGPLSELIKKLDGTGNVRHDERNFTTSWNMTYIRIVVAGRQKNAFKATLSPVLRATVYQIFAFKHFNVMKYLLFGIQKVLRKRKKY